jgi:hypothetical protein
MSAKKEAECSYDLMRQTVVRQRALWVAAVVVSAAEPSAATSVDFDEGVLTPEALGAEAPHITSDICRS